MRPAALDASLEAASRVDEQRRQVARDWERRVERARYEDARLRAFAAEQVEMHLDTALTGVQAVVEAETTDGRRLAVRCAHAKGAPENPLTRAQIEAKFRIYATGRLPATHIDEVIGTVARLEELESTRRLMDMLRVMR